jgi:hypothetical protein
MEPVERYQQHHEDAAEAGRLGADFGLGELKTTAQTVARIGLGQAVGGGVLAVAAVIAALVVALASTPWPPRLIVLAGAVAAFLAGWQLMRLGGRPRAINRLYRYAGGLIQLLYDEPEPRVLRWSDVDSVTVEFESVSEDRYTGLDTCTLRGSTGTEIAVRGWRPLSIPRGLATEADRVLRPRLLPPLIQAYESGELIAVGRQVRIEQAAITLGKLAPLPWTEVRAITVVYDKRSGSNVPADSIIISGSRRHSGTGFALSRVPNGFLIPYLIEYIAEQHGIPLRRSGPGYDGQNQLSGGAAARLRNTRRWLCLSTCGPIRTSGIPLARIPTADSRRTSTDSRPELSLRRSQ